MKLELKRVYKGNDYTIGKLYIDGEYFCDTIEDCDRGLTQDMSLEEINKIKVYGKTAIPTGTYKITLSVKSNKYSNFKKYKWAKICDGYIPRLLDVPGYEGILIHVGNKAEDSSGCILVGQNKIKGQVINSTITFNKLYDILKKAYEDKEDITNTIS